VQIKYKGVLKLAFSTNISLYVENGTRYWVCTKTLFKTVVLNPFIYWVIN